MMRGGRMVNVVEIGALWPVLFPWNATIFIIITGVENSSHHLRWF